ncbi:sodium:calcium antiporter [Aliiroseovarius sp. YM-037]|uniref:sodium:calcium antiporter n=1 Tax=Aliiroseovarius sp. YM-037 TaxID=3341728 RepID=UPI003A809BD8
MNATLLVCIGLAGLVVGGEMLVRGAVSAAKSLGISPMVIGVTLVGFGTSTPELVTSVQAALSGSSGIAIGNVVGSNIGNVLLILGIAALIAPVVVDPKAFKRDGAVLISATFFCLGVVLFGDVSRVVGMMFFLALIVYLSFTLRSERRGSGTPAAAVYEDEAEAVLGPDHAIGMAIAIAVLGLVITILGANWLGDKQTRRRCVRACLCSLYWRAAEVLRCACLLRG